MGIVFVFQVNKTNSFDCWFDREVCDGAWSRNHLSDFSCTNKVGLLNWCQERHFIKITNLTKKAKGSHYEDDICRTESEPSLEIFNILLKIFSIEYENSTVSERGFSLQSINFNEPEISKKYYFLLHKGYFTHF